MVAASKWKIWYDDGSTFSSDDGSPEEAPVDGILAILEKLTNNTILNHHGNEFYYWSGENWYAGNQASLERWMRVELPALKFGRWTKSSIWKEVIAESVEWQ